MISFIVPAYNEARLLGGTLRAINDAAVRTGEPFEVIVADDASTDDTARCAAREGARVVTTHNRKISATRNAGARASHGEWLIFVDADTLVNPRAVRAAVDALRGGAAAGGAIVEFDTPQPLHFRLLYPIFMRAYRFAGLAAGCFLFCTRTAFEAAGGFDESLFAAEEVALSRALRRTGPFVLLDEPVVSSARKMRSWSGLELIGVLFRIALEGMHGVRSRRHLDFWYGARRDDPHPPD